MILKAEAVKDRIERQLRQRERRTLNREDAKISAVLIPILEEKEQLFLAFTRRTKKVKYHKGQISFPGGEYQASDGSHLQTALRETEEEVGLRAPDVDVLGSLDDVFTYTSNFVITPYIGLTCLPLPYDFKPCEIETEEIIIIPISAFADRSSCRKGAFSFRGSQVKSEYFNYGDHLIWGATARILTQFLQVAVWPGR
jgi:8-oxo-dGTP pyrophosphatase MutT (NUDIX family)